MSEEDEKKRGKFWWLRDIVLFIVIIGGILAYQTWDLVGRGAAMPEFDLAVLDTEQTIASASLVGKPTVLYFWAPWCAVCEASSHNMNALVAAAGDDANVLSMAVEYKDVASVRGFVERNGSTYPVLLGDSAAREAFAVTSFPTIYVFDDEGRVSSSVVGYTTELGLRARLFWAGL